MIQATQQVLSLLLMVELLPKIIHIILKATKQMFCGFFLISYLLFYNLNEKLSRLFHRADLQPLLDD